VSNSDNDDWQTLGHHVPLLTNLQPAGAYLGEDFHRAGGVPAVVAELLKANLLPHPGRADRQRHAASEKTAPIAKPKTLM
jgi:dihydroxyacid dehydratase/phosphogluconate dehydratase